MSQGPIRAEALNVEETLPAARTMPPKEGGSLFTPALQSPASATHRLALVGSWSRQSSSLGSARVAEKHADGQSQHRGWVTPSPPDVQETK